MKSYLILEIYNLIADGNGVTITEIELYNESKKIPYTYITGYSSLANGENSTWRGSSWSATNLYDGDIRYTNNSEGNSSSIFVAASKNDGNWSRLVFDLGENSPEITEIKMWAGSPENRIPETVTFYVTNEYSREDFQTRKEDGLKKLYTHYFSTSDNYLKLIQKTLNPRKFLVKDGNDLYSLKGEEWVVVGEAPATIELFIEHGINVGNIQDRSQDLKKFSSSARLLMYSSGNEDNKLKITKVDTYNPIEKKYRGPGVIETKAEELPIGRHTLMINAEHENCIFEFSLNDGSAWTPAELDQLINIRNMSGMKLKIRVKMPDESAQVSAIAYKWI